MRLNSTCFEPLSLVLVSLTSGIPSAPDTLRLLAHTPFLDSSVLAIALPLITSTGLETNSQF